MATTTWGTVQEREAEIADLHGARAKLRESQLRRTEQQVAGAFSARPFTIRELRHLATQTYASPVISLYLNFEPQRLARERPSSSGSSTACGTRPWKRMGRGLTP